MHELKRCAVLVIALTASARSTFTTLNFDDLNPQPPFFLPIYDPPNPYKDIVLTAFSVFDPRSTRLEGVILPEDRNCATSRPNALLGSRIGGEDGTKPSLSVPSSRNESSFDLVSFKVKPLTAPPGNEQITLWVQAYRNTNGPVGISVEDVLKWHVEFPVRYPVHFVANMPDDWRGLRKVEMWAQYGPGKLDWEFCVDDISVHINTEENSNSNGRLELRSEQ